MSTATESAPYAIVAGRNPLAPQLVVELCYTAREALTALAAQLSAYPDADAIALHNGVSMGTIVTPAQREALTLQADTSRGSAKWQADGQPVGE